jgi:hypothetical protein
MVPSAARAPPRKTPDIAYRPLFASAEAFEIAMLVVLGFSDRDHMSAIANGQEEAAAILRTGVRKTESNDSHQLN